MIYFHNGTWYRQRFTPACVNLLTCTRLARAVVLAAASMLVPCKPVEAQVAPGTNANIKMRALTSAVVQDLVAKNFAALDEATFTAYFTDYYLQQFAQPDVHGATDKLPLNKLRIQLRISFFGKGKSGEPYDRLNALTFQMMREIIEKDHPIDVKYNAMLVIGDLNETELDVAAGTKLVPYSKAFDYMTRVINSRDVPDELRSAAVLGLKRQAEIDSK